MKIKEYRLSNGYIQTETKVGEYTFILNNWYWLVLAQEGLEGCHYHTIASQNAIKYFSKKEYKSYQDFGDCFLVFKDDTLHIYAKPNNYAKRYDEADCELLFKMHRNMFPKLVEFLKQEQDLISSTNEKDVEQRFKHRQRRFKLERICM